MCNGKNRRRMQMQQSTQRGAEALHVRVHLWRAGAWLAPRDQPLARASSVCTHPLRARACIRIHDVEEHSRAPLGYGCMMGASGTRRGRSASVIPYTYTHAYIISCMNAYSTHMDVQIPIQMRGFMLHSAPALAADAIRRHGTCSTLHLQYQVAFSRGCCPHAHPPPPPHKHHTPKARNTPGTSSVAASPTQMYVRNL